MDGSNGLPNSRGQIGIGALILFVAIVLVAATAAGVLLNTAGFLEAQAEATVEDSVSGVTDRVEVMSVTGTADANGEITEVTVMLMPSPGSSAVDLSETTVEIFVGGEAATLTYTAANESTPGSEFTAERLRNETSTTIDAQEHRGLITFELDDTIEPLENEESMTIVITAPSGTEAETQVTAPVRIDAGHTVRL